VSWDQEFFDPIILPGRKQPLRTLRDAAQYITKLPKAEHDADEWQAAMEALLLVAELDGATVVRAHRRAEGIEPRPRSGV
jgi:dihydroorotase